MSTADEVACRRVVVEFAVAINEWEIREFVFRRLAQGKDVSSARAALVRDFKAESHAELHEDLFRRYVYPRNRKHGTKPGSPNRIGREGCFFDVKADTIQSVTFRDATTAEVVTAWGYLLPGGVTMFVLRRKAGSWLIDSLKVQDAHEGWRSVPI